jgi:hypothetical protein
MVKNERRIFLGVGGVSEILNTSLVLGLGHFSEIKLSRKFLKSF